MADPGEKTMGFLDHLEELRHTLLRCAGALLLGMVLAVPFVRVILDALFTPLRELGLDPATFLQVPRVMGGFQIFLTVVFWSGLMVSLPFIVFFIAGFVFPGLHEHERRAIRRSAGVAVLLFFGGAALGYYGTVTYALKALLFGIHAWMGTQVDWIYLTDYIAFVLKLVIGFGVAFELPLVLLGLGYAGLVEVGQLREKRRHVIVGLLILAMILTPPDPISQIVMAGCLYVLYEGCILLLSRRRD